MRLEFGSLLFSCSTFVFCHFLISGGHFKWIREIVLIVGEIVIISGHFFLHEVLVYQ